MNPMRGSDIMKYNIIPFHDTYGINRNGEVYDFINECIVNVFIDNNHKYVCIDNFNYRIMELLLTTYISLYDDMNWDYTDGDFNNCTLNNLHIPIVSIDIISYEFMQINNHIYKRIPHYPNYFISDNGTVFSTTTKIFMRKKYDCDYPTLSFPTENRMSKIHKIPRLVFCTWKNIDLYSQSIIHHRDSKRYNSNLYNLEESNMFINTRYAILDGQKPVQFTISEIDKMCELYLMGYSFREIGVQLFDSDKKYVAIRNMIYRIKKGLAYKDLQVKYNLSEDTIASRYKLTPDQVHSICDKLELGQSCNSIAKEFGVNTASIYKIRDRERWVNISKQYNF